MTQESFQITSAAVSDRGLSEKRPHNEDSYLEMPEQGLFVVADGVGGAQAGDVASQMAVEILSEAFSNWQAGGDAEDRMKLAIERANSAVYQTSRDLPQLSTMASTIVALHVEGNIATIGHVGDSRLYRMNLNGQLFRETNDHSVVEEEVRAGRMTPFQAAHHPSRNIISRAVGAESTVDVEMKTIMIDSNTTFLLCSDGITRHLDDPDIREILETIPNPVEACAKMKEICYKRGAEDNLTAVVVKVGFTDENFADDFEEQTISTARSAAATSNVAAQTVSTGQIFQKTAEDKFEDTIQDEDNEVETKNSAPLPFKPVEQSKPKENTLSFQAVQPIERDEKIYRIDEEHGGSFLTKFLRSFVFLFLGGIIGAALYHFLWSSPTANQPVTTPPAMPQAQTPNIEYSTFEDARRSVDRNPELYIGSSNASAQSAEDFYLLGRAYFLTGRFAEAKTAFVKAKEKLGETKDINKKTLENDVAVGLSIVENNIARNEFINQKRLIGAAEKNTNTNVVP